MKLDPTNFRYITKEEFRVLTAIEMGMRNHDLVPVSLIESIAKITRGGTFKLLQNLLRNKLVSHENKKYDGYRVSYGGYDFLALRAFVSRGTIVGVGRRIGVGKESDVHCAEGPNGEIYALKLHRLGRISFRAIKQKRDYLRHREHASWMYMARLAAMKEFAYMKALKDEGFPVPTPLDQNRHCVLMTFIDAVPLYRVREMHNPTLVLERLMRLLVRLARAGLVHGDFNEFNLMIAEDDKATLIDFPQMIHMNHPNAAEQFDRDVKATCDFFRRRLDVDVIEWPTFEEVIKEISKDGVGALASLKVEGMSDKDHAALVSAHEGIGNRAGGDDDSDDEDDDDDAEDGEEEADEVEGADDGACEPEGVATFEKLVPEDGREALGDGAEEDAEIAAAAAVADSTTTDGREGAQALAGDGSINRFSNPFSSNRSSIYLSSSATGYEKVAAPVANPQEDPQEDKKEDDNSSSEDSEGPGTVNINNGKKVRRKVTAKSAKANLQKQQKKPPAKANCQKDKTSRKMKAEIKDHFS